MAKDEKIETRVTKEFKDKVRAAAAKEGRSVSNYTKQALADRMKQAD